MTWGEALDGLSALKFPSHTTPSKMEATHPLTRVNHSHLKLLACNLETVSRGQRHRNPVDKGVISEEETDLAIQDQSPSDSECHISGELTIVRDIVPSKLVNAKIPVCSLYMYLLTTSMTLCATRNCNESAAKYA